MSKVDEALLALVERTFADKLKVIEEMKEWKARAEKAEAELAKRGEKA